MEMCLRQWTPHCYGRSPRHCSALLVPNLSGRPAMGPQCEGMLVVCLCLGGYLRSCQSLAVVELVGSQDVGVWGLEQSRNWGSLDARLDVFTSGSG